MGCEWISSVDLENMIMAHPQVLEAPGAVPPPTWWRSRRAWCPNPSMAAASVRADILDFLCPRVAKFWLPDAVVFLETVPKTSVGKFDKKVLRERFKDWQPPGVRCLAFFADSYSWRSH